MILGAAGPLGAAIIQPVTITAVGCGTGTCMVTPSSNPSGCLYGNIYISVDAAGQGMYSTGMMAYTTGRSVRIDYTQDATKVCTATLILTTN
jgi:hypothetical protein